MHADTKEIRRLIAEKPPLQAILFVRSFGLTPEEENCILLKDIHGNSLLQISERFHCSPETVARRRESGYRKIYKSLHT